MVKITKAFSGFSVDDLGKAKVFYSDTLGIDVRKEGDMGLTLHLPGEIKIFVYPKEDHQPATFTILNFVVDDIDVTMETLNDKGVQFEQYDDENLPQDEKGVLRGLSAGNGPDITWFKDPAGNILSVIQEK